VTLPLPAKSAAGSDPVSVARVNDLLTSVIAGHPGAVNLYTFYEELDAWLGPWGSSGYPIGYGKFYCIAFNSNEKLMADAETKAWVWNTTILLQTALRDYVLSRQRAGTLNKITEPELRDAAFASHAKAYTKGDLTKVALAAPELLPIIMLIPKKEYVPAFVTWLQYGGAAFAIDPTLRQVVETILRMSGQLPGYVLGTLAGPAHTGILRNAVMRDQLALQDELAMGRNLAALRKAIDSGKLDDIQTLKRVSERLNATQFPDHDLASFAHQVVVAADARRDSIETWYDGILPNSPEIQKQFELQYRGMFK